MDSTRQQNNWIPLLSVSLRCVIIFIAVLPIPLSVAQALQLTPGQTTSWILILYGLAGILGLGLTFFYKQPLLLTGNLFALIFVASLGDDFSYSEIIGAFIVTGALMLFVSALGLTGRLASLIPAPIIFGLLAGAVTPFVMNIFISLGQVPLLVGGIILAYLLASRFLNQKLPPIFVALVVGLAIVLLSGQQGSVPAALPLPELSLTMPTFSFTAVVSITPILLILITVQSNLPSLIFMRNQGFQPPERVVDLVSGAGMMIGSFFGLTAVSISLPLTSLVAGPEAGAIEQRHRAGYLVAGASILIGLLAAVAVLLTQIFPAELFITLAGLAVVGVLVNALQQVTRGPLLLGPIFAFVITLSQMTFLGLSAYFWALLLGTAVSILLEREGLRQLQTQFTPTDNSPEQNS